MTRDKTTPPAMPHTLAEAYEAVDAIRPAQTASLSERLAYHQQSAAVYAEVAEIDRGHHHEALFMAEQERQHAKEIKTEISCQRPASDSEKEN
jgi:hypothetical protein